MVWYLFYEQIILVLGPSSDERLNSEISADGIGGVRWDWQGWQFDEMEGWGREDDTQVTEVSNLGFQISRVSQTSCILQNLKKALDMLSGAFAFEDEIVYMELSFVLNSPDSFNSESVIVHYWFSAMMLGGEITEESSLQTKVLTPSKLEWQEGAVIEILFHSVFTPTQLSSVYTHTYTLAKGK